MLRLNAKNRPFFAQLRHSLEAQPINSFPQQRPEARRDENPGFRIADGNCHFKKMNCNNAGQVAGME
jgi:hypothetical protein